MKLASQSPRSGKPLVIAALALLASTAHGIGILPGQYYTEAANLGLGSTPSGYYRNDDASFGAYSLGFSINYFGQTYDSFYLNNNGSISFGRGFGTYTPSQLNVTTVAPAIAPYWADVDTRPANGGNVYFNTSVANQLIVTWDNVGYYANHVDKRASFQLVLRGADYTLPGDEGNIGFFYKAIDWETGDASGGRDGVGGTPATVGFGDGLSTVSAGEVSLAGSQQNGISDVVENQHFWFNLDNGVVLGGSENTPILPGGTPLPGWTSVEPFWSFRNVFTGAWVDPIPTDDFYFQMAGSALFTGFRMPSLSYGNLSLSLLDGTLLDADLSPSEFYSFASPVSGFRIFGFDPLVDAENPTVFPIQLYFDQPNADFMMGSAPIVRADLGAVPEPSTYGLIAATALGVLIALRRRSKTRA